MTVYYGNTVPQDPSASSEDNLKTQFDQFFDRWWNHSTVAGAGPGAYLSAREELWKKYQAARAAGRTLTREEVQGTVSASTGLYGAPGRTVTPTSNDFKTLYGQLYGYGFGDESVSFDDQARTITNATATPPERIFNAIVSRYDLTVPDAVVSQMDAAEKAGEDPSAVFNTWLRENGKYAASEDFTEFNTLFNLVQANQMDELYAECLKLTANGKDWMVDGLQSGRDASGNPGQPTSDSIFGILKTYNVDTYKVASEAFWKQEATSQASEALQLESENNRINWTQKMLGRPLTTTEQAYVRITEQADASDVMSHEDIAMVYWMFGGASSAATNLIKAKAEAKWQSLITDDSVPLALRANYADFDATWEDYTAFARQSFDKAVASDTNKDILSADQIVPYDFWDYSEWLSADEAVTALREGYMLSDPGRMSVMQQWLEDHGMSGLAVTGLLKFPGESQADYEYRIRNTYVGRNAEGRTTVSGDDMLAIMQSNGLVAPSAATVLENAMPQIMEAIKAKVLPGIAPERREEFLNQMQVYIRGETEYSSSLWKMYGQIAGPLTPSVDVGAGREQINKYVEGFIGWASKNNYFTSPYVGNLPSAQTQLRTEQAKAVPTRLVVPKSFGLGV